MIFTSLNFLLFFGLLYVVLWAIKPQPTRQYILLVASYIFYSAWNPWFLFLIAGCSIINWYAGLRIAASSHTPTRTAWLIAGVSTSLAALFYFKYAMFGVEAVNALVGTSFNIGHIILPVGISFFTFQALSYTIDIYRKKIDVCTSLPKFLLFVSFFPQLVAGPIVRATEFLPQLQQRITLTGQNALIGGQLFIGGMLLKTIGADTLSTYVDGVFAAPHLFDNITLWAALVAYALQIFGDFAGYSLMAIGIARVLGFTLPVNFNMPYVATSVTEFWRRWHITLSTWLRDYVYIPMGGNRGGEIFTYRNLFLTMVIGGIWHGAGYNFILWGILHGAALVIHKLWHSHVSAKPLPFLLGWPITMFFILLTWLPFRSPNFATTWLYLKGMFAGSLGHNTWLYTQGLWIFAGMVVWHLIYIYAPTWLSKFPHLKPWRPLPFTVLCVCILIIALFAPLGVSPFIYFQF